MLASDFRYSLTGSEARCAKFYQCGLPGDCFCFERRLTLNGLASTIFGQRAPPCRFKPPKQDDPVIVSKLLHKVLSCGQKEIAKLPFAEKKLMELVALLLD